MSHSLQNAHDHVSCFSGACMDAHAVCVCGACFAIAAVAAIVKPLLALY